MYVGDSLSNSDIAANHIPGDSHIYANRIYRTIIPDVVNTEARPREERSIERELDGQDTRSTLRPRGETTQGRDEERDIPVRETNLQIQSSSRA